MAKQIVYRDCQVQVVFELADHHRYRGVATINFDDHGRKLTQDVETDETYEDRREATRRAEQLAREWIDHKRG